MSAWGELLDTIKDAAPTLAAAAGTALTGGNPAGGAALAALARKLTGSGKDAQPDDMAEQILGDPDKLMQFRSKAREMELEELRIRTADVQNARQTLDKSYGAVVVSIVVLVGYFVAMIFAMTQEIPRASQSLAYLLLGNLATGFGMVLTFWLGSSVGSKNKDKILARYADAAKSDQAARRAADG